MKRSILNILLAVCILIFFGCAGLKTERTVQDDNIFYSSNKPKIRIKINPDYKFTEEKSNYDSSRLTSEHGGKTPGVQTYRYFFPDRVSGKSRAVEIVIRELISPRWFFKPNIFNVKNKITSNDIKIQGKNYKCCTYAFRRPNDYVLVQGTGRLVGAESNAMIIIYYLEQVTGDWSDINVLTISQQQILNDFIEASKRDIQIIE